MQFGKYRLIRKVATGGMAEIFLARQDGIEGFRKDLVLKRILPVHADNSELIEMFLDEARIAATLNHPNIVQIFDLGKADGEFFIAMEYVHGQDLRRICERGLAVGNFLPLRHAVRIIADAAGGLHYAHTQNDSDGEALGIVHRDVSPQNLVVSFDGVVKVLDFGIAKAANKIVTTRTGQLKGKYAYMSPEQVNGLEVDHRSDIFSLGTLLYEIAVCTRLFKADTDVQTIKNVSEAIVRPPSDVRPEFPRDLEEIILKSLTLEPRDRYQSGQEFQEALEDFLRNNRMKTGPVQLGNYMREIFPDKLDWPTEDPSLMENPRSQASPAATRQPPAAEPAPQPTPRQAQTPAAGSPPQPAATSASALRPMTSPVSEDVEPPTEMLDTSAMDAGIEAGALSDAAAVADPDLPSGAPTVAEIKSWTHHSVDEPAPTAPLAQNTTPPAPTQPPAASTGKDEHVSFVVNQNAPYQTGSPVKKFKPKKQARQVQRSSVKTVEYQLRSLDDDEMDGYEKSSVVYFYLLALVVGGILLYAGYLIYQEGNPLASEDMLVTKDEDPLAGVDPEPPPPELPSTLLNIASVPAGATVVINGILQDGETPGDFKVVPGKINSVSLYNLGHMPTHRNLRIADNDTPEPIQVNLAEIDPKKLDDEADYGKLTLESDPPGALVLHNGRRAGQTPLTIDKAMANMEHHFVLQKEGFYDHVVIQHVYPGVENKLPPQQLVSQERDAAKRITELHIETRDVSIFFNDDFIGLGPYFKPIDRNEALRVELKKDDHHPFRRVFATTVGSATLAPRLKPINREPGTITVKIAPKTVTVFLGNNQYAPDEIKKLSLPGGDYDLILVNKNGERGELKLTVEPGEQVSYSVDFSGKEPMMRRLD